MAYKSNYFSYSNGKINFDLEDCDRILRVEAESISYQTIIELLNKNGFLAEVLT